MILTQWRNYGCCLWQFSRKYFSLHQIKRSSETVFKMNTQSLKEERNFGTQMTKYPNYTILAPSIINASEQSLEYRLALCKLEYESLKLDCVPQLPSEVSEEQWIEMVDKQSRSSRRKYLKYLYVTENRKILRKEKSLNRKVITNKLKEEKINEFQKYNEGKRHLVYGLWGNCFLNKISSNRIGKVYDSRVINAKLFGQAVVFDGCFIEEMNIKEQKNAALQLAFAFKLNRSNSDPFYIHLCNFNLKEPFNKPVKNAIPKILQDDFPCDVHQSSYLDVFDTNKLVYLSPHAEEELESFDHEAVYIIGHLVDLGPTKHITSDKAKQEGLKLKKFPLEKYLDWASGNKKLPIDQVLGILLELKNSGSWTKAFDKYIPKRKLRKVSGS